MSQNNYKAKMLKTSKKANIEELYRLILENSDKRSLFNFQDYPKHNTPLHYASFNGLSPEFIRILLNPELYNYPSITPADVNSKNKNCETPLYFACYSGNIQIVEELLKSGALLNQTNSNGETEIAIASYFGHTDIVKLLISKGVDVEIQDICGSSPLRKAILHNHIETVKVLVEQGNAKIDKDMIELALESNFKELGKYLENKL